MLIDIEGKNFSKIRIKLQYSKTIIRIVTRKQGAINEDAVFVPSILMLFSLECRKVSTTVLARQRSQRKVSHWDPHLFSIGKESAMDAMHAPKTGETFQ